MGRSRGALPGVRSLLRKHPDEVPTLPPPAQRGLRTWEGGSRQQKSRSLDAGSPWQAGGATGECPHVARIQGPEELPHPLATCPAECQARSGEQIQGTQTVRPHSDPQPRTCTRWAVGDQLPTSQKARKAGNPQRRGTRGRRWPPKGRHLSHINTPGVTRKWGSAPRAVLEVGRGRRCVRGRAAY